MNIEQIDNELYKSIYGMPKIGDYNQIWSKIKNNPEILRQAVQVKKDKFNERYIVEGLTISNVLLIDYGNADGIAYNNLINNIYENKDIARIVMNGASNGGFSFLLMSLFNRDLKLTEEQKAFAVDEAMNKIGTTRWYLDTQNFSNKLSNLGISDDETVFVNIDGCINPIGYKSGSEYMNYLFGSLSNTQAHGIGEFDIRYHILRNPNWSIEEKEKLIMDFWADDENYYEFFEQWEWEIINDFENWNDNEKSVFLEKEYLYDYSYESLLNIFGKKKIADKFWEKIEFCKQMRELRSPIYDESYQIQKVMK